MFQAQFVRIFSFVGRCSDQEQSIFSVYLSRLPGYNFFPLHTEETRDNGFVSHGLSVVDPNIWRHPIRPVVECPRARFFPFFFFFSLSFSLSFFVNVTFTKKYLSNRSLISNLYFPRAKSQMLRLNIEILITSSLVHIFFQLFRNHIRKI